MNNYILLGVFAVISFDKNYKKQFSELDKSEVKLPVTSDGIQGVRTGSCEPVLGMSRYLANPFLLFVLDHAWATFCHWGPKCAFGT